MFFEQFGRGANNKVIPDWVMRLPVDKQQHVLVGFWRGDGCKTPAGFNFGTTSQSLAEQVHVILLRLGIPTAVLRTTTRNSFATRAEHKQFKTAYTVPVNGGYANALASILGEESPCPNAVRNSAFILAGMAHYVVRTTLTKDVVDVPVYNLEVDGDHSYTVDGCSVHNCVEELSTSAAEPRIVGVRRLPDGGKEVVKEHPLLDLLERPNPFMSRYQFLASLVMYRAIAGNAYFEKVRSQAGRVVELWPLRPDRMFVIPDRTKHIKGWEYRLEGLPYYLQATDVVHTKTRNPLDDYYGLPPLAVCAERVDTDSFMRSFTLSFFRNAGVPAGLLNISKTCSEAEKEAIRNRFRDQVAGPQAWHSLLVLDDTDATFTNMGMPLGSSGIVLPELDEINEARLAMCFGVPLELISARLGMVHGNRSTTQAARAGFWDETLSPLYEELASDLSTGLVDPEYDGIDYLEFDKSTVQALQEDADAKHKRVREDLAAGVISVQEARQETGRSDDFPEGAILIVSNQVTVVPASTFLTMGQAPTVGEQGPPTLSNGHGKEPADLKQLAALAGGN